MRQSLGLMIRAGGLLLGACLLTAAAGMHLLRG